jgi:hypothetical protein
MGAKGCVVSQGILGEALNARLLKAIWIARRGNFGVNGLFDSPSTLHGFFVLSDGFQVNTSNGGAVRIMVWRRKFVP